MKVVLIALSVLAAGTGLFMFLARGPYSLKAAYDRDVACRLPPHDDDGDRIGEADLAHLPLPVQRYVRLAGFVGQPRIHNFRARMHGRIRSGPDARWMPLSAEQYNFTDAPTRLFYMTASMLGVPVQGYHRYIGPSARMTVKAAALVTVVDALGAEMDQSETVTLFNDMCMMAPGTLIDPAIAWEAVDARTARATFTNAGHTVRATLLFNDAGELADFQSDDRYQASRDGGTMEQLRWSTPLGAYRQVGPFRISSSGEARWHEPGGEYAYIELTIDDVQFNVRSR